MKSKKILSILLITATCAMFIVGIAATASAINVTLQTEQWYEWGRLYDYDSVNDKFIASNNNPYDGSGTQDLRNGIYEGTDTTEDSFGISLVNGIFETGNPSNSIYDDNTASSELTLFYSNGIDVQAQSITSDISRLYTEGFVARVYLDPDWDYDPAENYDGRGTDNDGNVGADRYAGATEGTLALELTGHVRYLDYSGIEADDSESYELRGTGNLQDGDVSGLIYLDVTDGIWASLYDTNRWDMSEFDGYGFSDFRLTTTLFPNTGTTEWNLEGVATAQGGLVPEPGTLTLLGFGLIGLAGIFRRKRG